VLHNIFVEEDTNEQERENQNGVVNESDTERDGEIYGVVALEGASMQGLMLSVLL